MKPNYTGNIRLTDLSVVLGIGALGLALAAPVAAYVRGSVKIQMCAENLRGIGLAAKIYANDNGERWMIPPFSHFAIDGEGIDYLNNDGTTRLPNTDPGEVGYERDVQTTSETPVSPDTASTTVSTTRAFWLLVRCGALDIEQFVCPSTRDEPDPTWFREAYYDFTSYDNISYGYQVPFGPRDTRPREGADNQQVFAADKGPYYFDRFHPTFRGPRHVGLEPAGPQGPWRRYNSPNHHGSGQNCLFSDAHVSFEELPTVGVHRDNIYTLMTDEWDGNWFNVIHGDSPHYSPYLCPYPGQGALGRDLGLFASTDSLIYP